MTKYLNDQEVLVSYGLNPLGISGSDFTKLKEQKLTYHPQLTYRALPVNGAISSDINTALPTANPDVYVKSALDLFQKIYSNFPRFLKTLSNNEDETIPFTNVKWKDLLDFLAYKHTLRQVNPLIGMERFAETTYLPTKLAPAYVQVAMEASALPYKLEELRTRTEELKSRKINPELAGEYLQFLFSSFPNFSLSLDEGLF